MQPVRVIIAAIFFVIGALIVIPAFTSGGKNTSNAEPVPATSGPTATTTTASPKPSVTKTTAKPTPTATKTASPKPTTTSPKPVPPVTPSSTPKPTSTPTPTRSTPVVPALVPLKVTFSKVDCPKRLVTVKVVNDDPATTQGYSIVRDGSIVLADQLGPKASRSSELTLKEDKASTVKITQDGKARATRVYKANCTAGPTKTAKPVPSNPERPTTLPKTGNDDTVMFARIATGAASMLTGAIVLWWGGLWPRRKDKMLG